MQENKPVLVWRQGRAGRLTLNRPNVIHALTHEMCQLMFDALMAWKDDPDVELVIVDHLAGSRGFCAGGDVKMISASAATDGVEALAFFQLEYNLNILIKNYPKPYVPIMDGVTMGGGKGIAILGSHRIATPQSVVAMPEGSIGLFPDVGGGWFLPRLPGELGTWMALTGGRVSGIDTLAYGIATHWCQSSDLAVLVENLCSCGIKALEVPYSDVMPTCSDHGSIVNRCFRFNSVEEIIIALDQTKADWALEQSAAIRQKCPMTLKVALRQLRLGAIATNFAQWMVIEYRISSRMCRRADFREGVRAALIDKDQRPVWMPQRFEDIGDADVDAMFAPIDQELVLREGVPAA